MIRSAWVLASALLVLLAPLAAGAQDADEARRLFGRGQQAFERGEYAAALADFDAAYAAAPLPGFLFNIAQCHRKLGDPARAADFYDRYLTELPDAPNRADALALRDEMRAVSVSAPPVAQAPPAPPAAAPAAPPRPAPPLRTPPAPPRSSSPLRPMAWVTLAVGAGLAVVSTVLALRVRSLQDELDAPGLDCRLETTRCLGLREDGRSAALWTNVLGVTALAALAAGLVLHLVAPSDDESADRTTLARW